MIINQYFLKYRATAAGLSLSGACVGSFALPFIVEYMLRKFGLPGTFLIIGGFILHALPAALLMTEPSWIKRNPVIKQESLKAKDNQKLKNSAAVQSLEKIREGVVETPTSMKKMSSSQIISAEKKEDEENFQIVTRNARVFSRNGIDNPAFVGSKTDLCERSTESVEVST